MLCTFLVWGMVTPWLTRKGMTTDRLIALGMPSSFRRAGAHPFRRAGGGRRAWALFCISSTFVALAQPAVGWCFRRRWPGGPCRPTTW